MTFRNKDGELDIPKIGKTVVLVILGLIIFFGSWFTIGAGEVGVVKRFGAVNRVAYPGIGFKIPLIENVVSMDTRTQKDQVDAAAASQDLQTVSSTIAVNYHLESDKAVIVYQNVGENYQDKVVAPAIQNTFKAVTAKFTAEQLIQNREEVRQQAEEQLKKQLTPYNIIVENFNIVNFNFSPEYNQAIEAKQVAQQSVQTANQVLIRTKVEADTAVAQAKGQADAQAALKNTGALTSEYLQYLAVNKWNGILPNVTGNGIPFVNIPIK